MYLHRRAHTRGHTPEHGEDLSLSLPLRSQSSCLSLHCSTQKAGLMTPTPQVYVDK